MFHHPFKYNARRIIALLAILNIICLTTSACEGSTSQKEVTPGPTSKSSINPQKTATSIPAAPRTTVDAQAPAEHKWKIIPYKVGPTYLDYREPGWDYITIYFAIENTGDQIDYFDPFGVQGYGSNFTVEPSHPLLADSSIRTKEGYEYPDLSMYNNDPKWRYQINSASMKLMGNMPVIVGDEKTFFNAADNFGQKNPYLPSYDSLPPIPPGSRMFGSIYFKVATNTSGRTWVVPEYGEFPLDNIGQDLKFPFQKRPDFIRNPGEVTKFEGGVTFKPLQFARDSSGSANLVMEIANPTGQDYSLMGLRLYLINNNGWILPGSINFGIGGHGYNIPQCYPPTNQYCNPVVGPGQTQKFTAGWQIPSQVGDVFLEVVASTLTTPGTPYHSQGWGVYELKKEAALAESGVQSTERAQSTAVAVAATATAEAQANAPAFNAVREFIQGIQAGSSEVANRYYDPNRSQTPGNPQDARERLGQKIIDAGKKYSPIDTLYLSSCFSMIPIDTVVFNNDPYSGNIWLSDTRDQVSVTAKDGSQQTVIFYLRGQEPTYYLESIFVSGCTALPTAPAGWTPLGLVGEPIIDIASSKNVVYVATHTASHGIFESEDLGKSWKAVNNGLEKLNIIQIETSPENPNLVYSVDGGLWRSENGGATWLKSNPPGMVCGNARGMTLGSNDGTKIYWRYCGGAFSISDDSGMNWRNQGVEFWYGNMLRSAPSDRNIVYAFTLSYGYSLQPDYVFPTMQRYNSNTNQWLPLAKVGTGLDILDLEVSYQNSAELYVGTPNGIYRSTDEGGSWMPVNNTLPNQGSNLRCSDLATSPWTLGEVFAVCNGQVYQTSDSGTTWSLIESPVGVRVIDLISESKVVLAATEKFGLYSYNLP